MHAIMAFAGDLHKESPYYRRFTLAPERVREYVESMIDDPDCAGWVAVDGELVIGFIMAGIYETKWFAERIAHEESLYITPAARNTRRGAEAVLGLLGAFVRWASEHGAHAEAGVSTQINEAATVRMYERLGFQTHGRLFHIGAK